MEFPFQNTTTPMNKAKLFTIYYAHRAGGLSYTYSQSLNFEKIKERFDKESVKMGGIPMEKKAHFEEGWLFGAQNDSGERIFLVEILIEA